MTAQSNDLMVIEMPTDAEVRRLVREAHRLRAQMITGFIKSLFSRQAKPHRSAGRVSGDLSGTNVGVAA